MIEVLVSEFEGEFEIRMSPGKYFISSWEIPDWGGWVVGIKEKDRYLSYEHEYILDWVSIRPK